MDELKVFRQALSPLEVAELHQPALDATLKAAKSGAAAAKAAVREHWLARVDEESAKARQTVIAARKNLEDDFLGGLPLIMVMKESPRPRPFYVLTRGDYASPDVKRPVQPAPRRRSCRSRPRPRRTASASRSGRWLPKTRSPRACR